MPIERSDVGNQAETGAMVLQSSSKKELEMPVEFIGMLNTNGMSESRQPRGPGIDKAYLGAIAQAHEHAGFDRVLIGYFSFGPDGFQVASFAAAQTKKLKLLLAHRPGFVAPALAARQLATLDHFSDGRLAVHIITGGDDAEQEKEGDRSKRQLHRPGRYAGTGD